MTPSVTAPGYKNGSDSTVLYNV